MIMKTLYLTQDKIGIQSGGGSVTKNELKALQEFNPNTDVIPYDCTIPDLDPFQQDQYMLDKIISKYGTIVPDLVHCYSGCLSKSISYLKQHGSKVSYLAAAHDKDESIKEFELINQYPFPFKHLTDPSLWKEYVRGYLEADLLITPSNHSKKVMEGYGYNKHIEVIPHGTDLNTDPYTPIPATFITGYLGAFGSDKGITYLLKAWSLLNYKDGSKLILAGKESKSNYVQYLIQKNRASNVECIGWVDNVKDFYNNISLLVHPSISEGFGLEILEAMDYYRPVIASKTAGASDLLFDHWLVEPRDYQSLANKIDTVKNIFKIVDSDWFTNWNKMASNYGWESISYLYQNAWKKLMES